MDSVDTKTLIFYLFRQKYYNTMLSVCKDAISRYNDEVCFNFYYALALLLNQRHQEALQEFESLKSETSTKLSASLLISYTNKLLKNTDREIDTRELKKSATASDLYNCAYALFTLGKYEKALDLAERALKLDASLYECYSLKGWISVFMSRNGIEPNSKISELFKTALNENIRNLDCVIGLCESLCIEHRIEEALSHVNKAIVRFPSNVLPLTAKLNLLFTSKDYDQTLETANRIFDLDLNNIDATKMKVLILIIRDSNYEEAAVWIKKLVKELDCREPKNSYLLVDIAQLYSRVSNRNITILSETFKMVEAAISKTPGVPDFLTEMGYQCFLQNNLREALRYFKSVLKINDTSLEALMGSSLCELLQNGNENHVKDQLEFLFELQENDIPALLYYLKAKTSGNNSEKLQYLNLSTEAHLKPLNYHVYSENYLRLLNPDLLMDIVKEYLNFVTFSSQVQNFKTTKIQDGALTSALKILKLINSACPGYEQALNLLAKISYFHGDIVEATKLSEQIIKLNPNLSEPYLLMAQIQISKKMYDSASQSLESGLSNDFKLRENPLFHLISGLIEKHKNNFEESIKYFMTSLNLSELKNTDFEFSLSDKASVYIELIQIHNVLNQQHEATKLLQDAVELFKDTSEESKIIVLSAEHLMKNRDAQTAIDLLNKVRSDDTYYLDAKTKLAQIFLKHRKDKKAYLQCYQEMIEILPGPESYVLLGDAYLDILELEKALESYEKAVKINPRDPALTRKMGEALTITHNYEKAIVYYSDTIKLTDDPDIKLQLVNLYVKLKQTENAERFLRAEIDLEQNKRNNDTTSLKYLIKLRHLLATICEKNGNMREALDVLTSTSETQLRLNKLYLVQLPELPEEELNCSIELYKKMADLASGLRDSTQAIKFYKDALNIAPNNVKILACLAKLYMQLNQMDLCQQTCNTLLSIDNENEEGTVLMADIAFRKVDFDLAIFHFTQLLSKQPTNWRTLVRFVEIMRRTGNLADVSKYIDAAEKLVTTPSKDPCFCYCLALHQWYSGNLNGALRNFNIARQSAEWNRMAIYNMIEICLNPEDEILGEQFIDVDDIEYKDSRSMALKTAERLLKELKLKLDASGEDSLKYKLFKNFLLLASKEKHSIEIALEDLINIASQDVYKDNVGPVLGIATAHTLLKQSQRAKNQLKRVVKTVWSFDEAEYLERCWLLLADYYMQSSKYDLAMELLKKILQHNRACCKAHEFYGQIAEKEQKYKEAAQMYNLAWKYGGRNNATIGYRLAHSHMKSKKYADAIDVCQQVLKQHPDYPKIRKDILDKSLANLRT